MKSETIKGYKLSLNPLIRKILVLQILAIIRGKIDVLVYFSIMPHYIFLIFCRKLEIINKGYKLNPNPVFFRKIPVWLILEKMKGTSYFQVFGKYGLVLAITIQNCFF